MIVAATDDGGGEPCRKPPRAAGEAAPLDDRDDAFLSSFPFSRDAPKAFSVGAGDGDVTVTYTSLAAKAALVPRSRFARGERRPGAKTFR